MIHKRNDKKPITVESIEEATFIGTTRVKTARKALASYDLDTKRDGRLSPRQGKCRPCYYIRGEGISGQALSERECKNENCKGVSRWHNTAVPDYCEDCSKKYGICRSCGGDLEEKPRRSLKAPKRHF